MNIVYARSATSGMAGCFDSMLARWAKDSGSQSLICVSDSSEVAKSLRTELLTDEFGGRNTVTTVSPTARGDRELAWQAVLLAAEDDALILCRGLALARALAGNRRLAGRLVVAIDDSDWFAYEASPNQTERTLSSSALVLVPDRLRSKVSSTGWVCPERVWSVDTQVSDVLNELTGETSVPASLRLQTLLASRILVEIDVEPAAEVTGSDNVRLWDLADCAVRFELIDKHPTVTFSAKPSSRWGKDTPGRQLWRSRRLKETLGLAAFVTSDVSLAGYSAAHHDLAETTWFLLPPGVLEAWSTKDWEKFAAAARLVGKVIADNPEDVRAIELRFPSLIGKVSGTGNHSEEAPARAAQRMAVRYGATQPHLVVGARRRRLLVVSHDMKFALPIIESLRRRDGLSVTSFTWPNQHSAPAGDVMKATADCDVVWVEFASGAAQWHAAHKGDHRLVVRVHGYEVTGPWGDQIDFNKVDLVVFPSKHLRAQGISRWGLQSERTVVIPNLVDHWALQRPKNELAPWTLGLLGWSLGLKRFDRALALLARLLETDPRFALSVKGKAPQTLDWVWNDPIQRIMFEGAFSALRSDRRLASRVFFEDSGPDVPAWLAGVGWILSPSDRESFHLAAIEGAASGSVPVVWDRAGAKDLFDESFVVADVSEAEELILGALGRQGSGGLGPVSRQRVEHCDLPRVMDLWGSALEVGGGPWT